MSKPEARALEDIWRIVRNDFCLKQPKGAHIPERDSCNRNKPNMTHKPGEVISKLQRATTLCSYIH